MTGDVLNITGTANNDAIQVSVSEGEGGWIVDVSVNGISEFVSAASLSSINVLGGAGDDMLQLNSVLPSPVAFSGVGNDTLNVNFGNLSFTSDLQASTPSLTVNVASGASVSFGATQHLAGLNINGGSVIVPAGAAKTLVLNSFSLTNAGSLNLNNNGMIVSGVSRSTIEAHIKTGYAAGNWLGGGIMSGSANTFAGAGSRALGVILGSDAGFSTLNGQTFGGSDVLVKFTYTGDANLDGAVNFDDFNKFLAGYANAPTNPARWLTGDFNFDGVVNFDDFNKFLAGFNAYNASGVVL
jgi:hypothetical protein